jgi:hypothetical protein
MMQCILLMHTRAHTHTHTHTHTHKTHTHTNTHENLEDSSKHEFTIRLHMYIYKPLFLPTFDPILARSVTNLYQQCHNCPGTNSVTTPTPKVPTLTSKVPTDQHQRYQQCHQLLPAAMRPTTRARARSRALNIVSMSSLPQKSQKSMP